MPDTPTPFEPELPPGCRFQMKVLHGMWNLWQPCGSWATFAEATSAAQDMMATAERLPFRVVDENGAVLIYYSPPV